MSGKPYRLRELLVSFLSLSKTKNTADLAPLRCFVYHTFLDFIFARASIYQIRYAAGQAAGCRGEKTFIPADNAQCPGTERNYGVNA